MAEAVYRRGEYATADYTPGSDVAAGEIVTIGTSLAIAHQPIAANEKGTVAVGGGIYTVTMATGTNTSAIGALTTTYFDTTLNWARSGTNANTLRLGLALEAAGTSAASVEVLHVPVV